MVIGLFLTAGIVQVFVANKQTYRFNEALARMQENGRYALELITSDLRMADFWGCSRPGKVKDNLNPGDDEDAAVPFFGSLPGPPYSPAVGLLGTEGATAAVSDEIEIRGAAEAGLVLAKKMDSAASNLIVAAAVSQDCSGNPPRPGVGALCPDDLALVSDCRSGDIFQVTDVAGAEEGAALSHTQRKEPGNNYSPSLSEVYAAGASVYVARRLLYLVATGAGGQPSLRRREHNKTQPVAEGVAGMQITYGRDLDLTDNVHRANQYQPAPATPPAGWFNNVVTVRVALLLQSTEAGLADSPQQVEFNGRTIPCPDRRLCQVMTGTVTLRNRVQ